MLHALHLSLAMDLLILDQPKKLLYKLIVYGSTNIKWSYEHCIISDCNLTIVSIILIDMIDAIYQTKNPNIACLSKGRLDTILYGPLVGLQTHTSPVLINISHVTNCRAAQRRWFILYLFFDSESMSSHFINQTHHGLWCLWRLIQKA